MESVSKNLQRLINQTWKVLPMKENGEEWSRQLDTILIEIIGLNEIFYRHPQILQILCKIEGLKEAKLEFPVFRKTVFEIIGLISGLRNVLV